jgi:hypothetical protein
VQNRLLTENPALGIGANTAIFSVVPGVENQNPRKTTDKGLFSAYDMLQDQSPAGG